VKPFGSYFHRGPFYWNEHNVSVRTLKKNPFLRIEPVNPSGGGRDQMAETHDVVAPLFDTEPECQRQ
jgi:hypothetical protein